MGSGVRCAIPPAPQAAHHRRCIMARDFVYVHGFRLRYTSVSAHAKDVPCPMQSHHFRSMRSSAQPAPWTMLSTTAFILRRVTMRALWPSGPTARGHPGIATRAHALRDILERFIRPAPERWTVAREDLHRAIDDALT